MSLNLTYRLSESLNGVASEELLLLLHLLGEGLGHLINKEMEVLGPLPLDNGPQSLDGVQLAAVSREEELLEVIIVDLIQLFRMVDPQVVKHHHHPPPLALLFQCLHEVEKQIRVVVLHKYLKMN